MIQQASLDVAKLPVQQLDAQFSLEVAKAAIQQMNSQAALVISLSLAICAGLMFLMLQVLVHDHDRSKKRISFRSSWLLFTSLVLQILSVCGGLLQVAAISDAVPLIFKENFKDPGYLSETRFAQTGEIYWTGLAQMLCFLLSVVLMTVFILINRRLIAVQRSSHGEE